MQDCRRQHQNKITRFYYQIKFLFFGFHKNSKFGDYTFRSLQFFFLHYTIRRLSCKYEPLTQGNGLNPNYDGSSTVRDVPKHISHVRVQCTLNFACCTIKGEWIALILFVRPSLQTRPKKKWQSSSSVTTVVCARLVLAGDDAPRAVPSDARHDRRYWPEGRKIWLTHSTTNSGLHIPFCPRADDADHVRDVQRAQAQEDCAPAVKDWFLLSLFGRPRSCLWGVIPKWWRPFFSTWWQFKVEGSGSMSSTNLISGRFHRRAATTMAELGENPLQQLESMLEFVTFLDNKLQGQSRAHFSAAANVDQSQKETCKARRRQDADEDGEDDSDAKRPDTLHDWVSLIPLVKLRYQGSHVPSRLGSLFTILAWLTVCLSGSDRVAVCCYFFVILPTWVSIPPLLFVSSWTEANSVRYTSKIANYVSSRFSPVPSLAQCVDSNDQCHGNQCCPGFDGRLHRPSSCYKADNNFDGCETNVKHDLHNVSLLDFSKIVEMTSHTDQSEKITFFGPLRINYRITLHFFVPAWINEELHEIVLHFDSLRIIYVILMLPKVRMDGIQARSLGFGNWSISFILLLKFIHVVNNDTTMHAVHTCTVAFSTQPGSSVVSVIILADRAHSGQMTHSHFNSSW